MAITKPPRMHFPVDLLDIGDSFFIPTVDHKLVTAPVRALARELGIEVRFVYGIDRATDMYGVRVTRFV